MSFEDEKPDHSFRNALIIVALVFTLFTCARRSTYENEEAAQPAEPAFDASTAITIDADDLSSEFGANEVAANQKFNSTPLILTGSIGNVEEGSLGRDGPEVHFQTSPPVIARIADRQRAASLSPQDRVTLHCRGAKVEYTLVIASLCEVAQVEKLGT